MRTIRRAVAALLAPLLFSVATPPATADHTSPAPCSFAAPVFAKAWQTLADPGGRELVAIINAQGDPIAFAIALNSGGVTWHLWSGDSATDGHLWHDGSATPTSPGFIVTEASPFDRVCLEIRYVGPGTTSSVQAVAKVSDDKLP